MIKMKKRDIFSVAEWLHSQGRPTDVPPKHGYISMKLKEISDKKAEEKKPLQPEQLVNMETEASGHETQVSITKENIVKLFDEAKEDIKESLKITLQPPNGYILFPEPEQNYEINEEE